MFKVIKAPGEIYHIYNRGTDKRLIFMDDSDRDRFIELLFFCNSTKAVRLDDLHRNFAQGRTLRELFRSYDREDTLVSLVAYCLMPNHFHLLIHEKQEGGITKFMQKLSNGYTGYFNKKYQRRGVLFSGKYKIQHVDSDRYLKYLLSYIHLNPVKLIEPKWKETGIKNRSGAKIYLTKYRYSSYQDYCGAERDENILLSMKELKQYYNHGTPRNFKQSVEEWLTYRES